MDSPEHVLRFWFPPLAPNDPAAIPRQLEWWFRGGADADINTRFRPLFERAEQGSLDGWVENARSRLALIIVLDQFSRTIYRGDARAYALDPKARSLARSGIESGHYAALDSPWEKTFFFLPLGHSEDLQDLDAPCSSPRSWSGRRPPSSAGCSSIPRRRPADTVMSSPVSDVSRTAIRCWAASRRRKSSSTLQAPCSSTSAPSRGRTPESCDFVPRDWCCYATEVLGGIVAIARRLGLARLEAICHAQHRASSRVLEKNGFVCEGLLPGHTVFPNLEPRSACDVLAWAFVLS